MLTTQELGNDVSRTSFDLPQEFVDEAIVFRN